MNYSLTNSEHGSILVVDDTPANLQLLINLLSKKGYTVRPMPSGKLALQGIHLDYPDLILLDIQMPDMDGYEVCNHLKVDPRTQNIPVIFISALDDIFDKIKAFQVGGIDYITKPFHAEEVFARVKTHITLYRLQKQLQEKTEDQDRELQEKNRILEQMIEHLEKTNQKLKKRMEELQKAQLQLVQSEKMSTLGQLVAGVAHEINNPIGFIEGNIRYALEYVENLIHLVTLYQNKSSTPHAEIQEYIEDMDMDFLIEDFPKAIASMKTGVERIRNISNALRTFSRKDNDQKVSFNIHDGIDSTLLILKHRIKDNGEHPAIEIIREYGELPEINCFPGKLNQVFMNIIANSIDALEESNVGRTFEEIEARHNRIIITTEIDSENQQIIIRIKDNGMGMTEQVKQKIFDHLFTTKGVGKGTGLGLSISRQIVEEKHGGKLTCNSSLGEGTEFVIALPRQ
ncbi:MAG: response regulator [Okeania sp. SIO2C9]|uniref:hybrid sensor histidine kinase/response regulator n=1 Tax=Okeania sp. SIO2C9 TaxID=2607791 RepID=UPI0013C17851|nr:response regulator [Okeania sp. SIO2C9]NEQ78383.1 response regulator [Okeania sp. SIO2C9]